ALVTGSVIGSAVIRTKNQGHKTKHPGEWLVSVPRTQSKVKDLEIVNARIIAPGSNMPGVGVAFEILNNSDRPVMAVRITCGNGGLSKDGLHDEDQPVVVIEPHGVLTAEMYDELT